MSYSHELPVTLWFGRTLGEWPIQCFESESIATDWLRNAGQSNRKLWKASVSEAEEYKLVEPEPFLKKVEDE